MIFVVCDDVELAYSPPPSKKADRKEAKLPLEVKHGCSWQFLLWTLKSFKLFLMIHQLFFGDTLIYPTTQFGKLANCACLLPIGRQLKFEMFLKSEKHL